MKVALITLEGGGISTVCYGLAHSLAKKKIPTTVFTEAFGKPSVEKINEFLTVKRLGRLNLPPRCLWFQIQNFRFLTKELKDYSLVHGISPDASVLFTFQKRRLGKPFIAHFHAPPLSAAMTYLNVPVSHWTAAEVAHHILEYPMHDFVIRRCVADADRIIGCSYTALKEFKSAYKRLSMNRVIVIYNSVNFDEIDNIKGNPEKAEEKTGTSIIFAGRLFWLKGPLYLLKAFEMLRKECKDLRLEIFGKGPEESRMKKFVLHAGLEKRISFHGHVSHMDLLAEIKRADVAIAPSLQEAQSLFLLETMACKKPLVVFGIPSAREIIRDKKNGLLVKPFDVRDLSEKIRWIVSDRKLQLKIGQNAYIYAKREHNWQTQIEKYLEVYRKVV